LKTYHKEVFTYAGKRKDSDSVVIIATVIDKRLNYGYDDISTIVACEVDIIYNEPIKENSLIRKHTFETRVLLTKEREEKIQSVIGKHIDYLMRAHSNLNAIKASAIRSKEGGSKIIAEECIVLFCTRKGIIPLLETSFPKHLDAYAVDVREGNFRFGNNYETILAMGLAIECEGSKKVGTLGPFVDEQDRSGNKLPCFLTCSHVCLDNKEMALNDKLRAGIQRHRIFQPSFDTQRLHLLPNSTICGEVGAIFLGHVEVDGIKIGVDIASIKITNKDRIPCNARFSEIDDHTANISRGKLYSTYIFSLSEHLISPLVFTEVHVVLSFVFPCFML